MAIDPLTEIGRELTPQRTRGAVVWFRNQILRVTGRPVREEPVAPGTQRLKTKPDIVRPLTRVTNESIGAMCTFAYDPKYKGFLPYYDRYPIIFVVHVKADRFLGINLHYLPPEMRKALMIELLKINKIDSGRRIELSYNFLKGATGNVRFYKPCIKQYLKSHVYSSFAFVPAEEWHLAAALPLQRFIKQPDSIVWADSVRMLS